MRTPHARKKPIHMRFRQSAAVMQLVEKCIQLQDQIGQPLRIVRTHRADRRLVLSLASPIRVRVVRNAARDEMKLVNHVRQPFDLRSHSAFALHQSAGRFAVLVILTALCDLASNASELLIGQQRGPSRVNRGQTAQRTGRRFVVAGAGGTDRLTCYGSHAFSERVRTYVAVLVDLLEKLRAGGATVVGYGASTKGNVLLQFAGLGPEHIQAIGEINPDKYGCCTPGTHIPIVSDAEARAMKPDYFLVLPWHFRNDILRREDEFQRTGGRFLFPLPVPEVV